MQPWLIALIAVISAVAFVALCLFALAAAVNAVGFSSRCDRNPLLKYFEGKDFGLPEREIEIPKGKILLRGRVYGAPSQILVLFCHGLGAGHIAYTTEIAALCRAGAQVVAVDYEGCNLSEGKSIRGMCSGTECVLAAIRNIRSNAEFSDKKIWLFGHSWGGYSALCAAQREKVDGVVAISAPDDPVDTLYFSAASILGKPICTLLKPFWRLLNVVRFGKYGNARASARLPVSVPILLVHGADDNVVPIAYSAFVHAEGDNVQKLLCKGKSHNPYNSSAAQKLIIELSANLSRVRKMTEEERKGYFGSFDFVAATEEDEDVMDAMIGFIGLK